MANAAAKYLIVNADDLGFSPGVTEGILRAAREGIVTSCTLMTNMPGAQAALGRLPEAPLLGVGVHLNASQGPPLLEHRLAGRDGVMNRTAAGVIALCAGTSWGLDAVTAEFEAQIRWALDRGLKPTHLDSHRHGHAFTPLFARVAELARRYDIRFVRRLRERMPGRWPAAATKQRRIRALLNVFDVLNRSWDPHVLATSGTWGVAHTGAIDRQWLVLAAGRLAPGITEIMTHPGLGDVAAGGAATRLTASRQAELDALCDPQVRQAMEDNGITLIHYGQIAR
jgi:predicted glycoside hydrolase/deacetylase ChbG (UPF0249 family)